MSEEVVTISRKEYDSLVDDSLRLRGLDAGGVDNWDWYYESLKECTVISVGGKDYSYIDYMEYLDSQ